MPAYSKHRRYLTLLMARILMRSSMFWKPVAVAGDSVAAFHIISPFSLKTLQSPKTNKAMAITHAINQSFSSTCLNLSNRKRNSQQTGQLNSVELEDLSTAGSGYQRPLINWYPGHIAKAEKMLATTLQSVDLVIEVRDARCPKATSHPQVGEWVRGKPRIVVLTHADAVPIASKRQWQRSYNRFGAAKWDEALTKTSQHEAFQNIRNRASTQAPHRTPALSKDLVEAVIFVDAKRGQGIFAISRAICQAGAHVNEKRRRIGLMNRPLRVGIMGYPNVGKSALINRILGRNRAKSENTPGVTRTLQWIRVSDRSTTSTTVKGSATGNTGVDFELLDSPGIIPLLKKMDQSDALLLAACNSIGDAAYDNQNVAANLLGWIQAVHLMGRGDVAAPEWRKKCLQRYGFDPILPRKIVSEFENIQTARVLSGEDMLHLVAQNTCRGDMENAARKILQDFRTGRVGPVCLQLPGEAEQAEAPVICDGSDWATRIKEAGQSEQMEWQALKEQERSRLATEAVNKAKEKQLELPPAILEISERVVVESGSSLSGESVAAKIGKGLFDGW